VARLARVKDRDWHAWHLDYDRPDSELSRRLAHVQDRIRIALNDAPPGPLRLVSVVAGQGRDVIPVLASHPRGRDVTGLLVELDPRNTAAARYAADAAGITGLEVVTGDAADLDHYRPYAPADVVVMCGLFGNISHEDIRRMVGLAVPLTKRGGTVIWTRGKHGLDMVPTISGWFADEGFEELFVSDSANSFRVSAHRSLVDPTPLPNGVSAFVFVGH
jgi:Putative methyltransferase